MGRVPARTSFWPDLTSLSYISACRKRAVPISATTGLVRKAHRSHRSNSSKTPPPSPPPCYGTGTLLSSLAEAGTFTQQVTELLGLTYFLR